MAPAKRLRSPAFKSISFTQGPFSQGSLRLAAQDVALSRRKQGFESPRERQIKRVIDSPALPAKQAAPAQSAKKISRTRYCRRATQMIVVPNGIGSEALIKPASMRARR